MTAAQLLKPCPASGQGVHTWVCYAACTLVEAGLSDEQAESEIEALMTREPSPASEIKDALRYARGDRRSGSPRWSPINPGAIAAIAKDAPTLVELVSRSPSRFNSARRAAASCEANTGPRRFLVVEFDSGTLDQQAALLWHFAKFAPLALVVFSGSKSAHSWYFCDGQPEDKLQRFFDYAVSLGADPRTWSRSQFVRLADGKRSDGKTSDAALKKFA